MLHLVSHPDVHPLDRTNPLYVGNFYRLARVGWKSRIRKQGFVLSLALTWKNVSKLPIENDFFLTSIRGKANRLAFEKFFEVRKIGYSVDGKTAPSIVVPRQLPQKLKLAIDALDIKSVYYTPKVPPKDLTLTQSEVLVSPIALDDITSFLEEIGRCDLLPQVTWLLAQPNPVKFFFKASGNLKARDTSVWPIIAIETWPKVLRKKLFPSSVDIDGAFLQYLIQQLEKKNTEKLMSLKYPDLLNAFYNKDEYRDDLLNLLHLPDAQGKHVVKKLIMSVANGSMISEKALVNRTCRRYTAHQLIYETCPHLSNNELIALATPLRRLKKQIVTARKELCIPLLGERPTRKSSKKIFTKYFYWEREARYALHKELGGTGIMVHDALEGVIQNNKNLHLLTGIRVSST